MYKCPLCNYVGEYRHVVTVHADFWNPLVPRGPLPDTVAEFNERFGMLGFMIKEVKFHEPPRVP